MEDEQVEKKNQDDSVGPDKETDEEGGGGGEGYDTT